MAELVQRLNLGAWYQASRPRVFTASYVPMALAAAAALEDGFFQPALFVLALAGVILLQTGANLINEYADFKRGADALKEAGQGLTIKRSILTPEQVRAGAIAATAAGSALGLLLLAHSGPLLWLIGIGAVLVVITYTAGPFPLAYHGLGEIAVAIFLGPAVVIGAYYVMAPAALTADKALALTLVTLPVAFMVAAILHANNIRDLDADRAANKRTLAVMFGRRFARAEYLFLVSGAYVALALLVIGGLLPWPALAALVTLPEALRLIRIFNTSTDVPLMHMAQGRTARLHGRFGLLMALGWLVFVAVSS
jgi:1,4-dihydroxy-2-naphthoate octaprenyltransferase